MTVSQVPSVNLTHYTHGSKEQQQQFVADIGNAFSTIGFVALSGHYLEQQLSENLYDAVKRFFDLPDSVKLKYEIEGLAGQRGYTSFGKETAKGQKVADLKEFWHFGQYHDPDSIYPPNIEVLEVPEFNLYGELVYKALEKTALELLRALSEYLSLPKHYFDSFITGGNSILRPIHYPPVNENEQKAVRAAAHGDINLITLLMGAHGKGLQVQRLDGQWIDAIASSDELMINVGDMLSRHTNNRLKSTIHRVINPERSQNQSRYSIPFFMHPKMTMPLNVLEHCISEDNPKLFEDITAGAFLDERLRELGLLK
ncbi:MAG: isopenicillin N synthase family dioxygenase [Flavobacteriaceae bacterium]